MSGRSRIDPLVLRVRPKAHEGGMSLLARLAARYGEPNLVAFARDLGIRPEALSRGHGIVRLAACAGLDPVPLIEASPSVDVRSRTVLFGRTSVALGDWSRSDGRFCPHCTADDTSVAKASGRSPTIEIHRRFWWDIASVTHCPVHGTKLGDTCMACGIASAWGAVPGICRACGSSLSTRRCAPGPDDGTFSVYAVARLMGREPDAPLLAGMELKEVVLQLERLGLALTVPLADRKPRRHDVCLADAREAGYRALPSWPVAFEAALDRLIAEGRKATRPAGLIGAYGWVYEGWCARLDPASAFGSAVRSTLRVHAIRNGVIAEDEATLGGGDHSVIGLSCAARLLGWGYRRTRREAGRLGAIPTGTRRGVGIRLGTVAVRDMARSADPTVGTREVARLLGIGKMQAARIGIGGLLGPATLGPGNRYSRNGCVDFLRRLEEGAPVLAVVPRGALTLPRACQAAGVTLEDACRLILAGEVPLIGTTAATGTMADLMIARGILGSRSGEGAMSFARAAGETGITEPSLRHLAARGLLGSGRAGARRIDVVALAEFRGAYMSGTEAAALIGISSGSTRRRLRQRSVEPVASPPACRQLIYRRSDVEAAVSVSRCGGRGNAGARCER